MEKNLKNTKTEKNLQEAFAGESMARNKYTFYASRAKKDGYQQVGAIFEETAGNEKEHAEIWFKYLHDNAMPDTITNLLEAAGGEHGEWSDMYARMAKDAREEGFTEIAARFEGVGKIEKSHEARYLKLADNIKKGIAFDRRMKVMWKCRNCGHIFSGSHAPETCPVCSHPKAYFELLTENY